MLAKVKRFGSTVHQAYKDFSDDDCLSMGAALAYYTIFSLPALLVVVIAVAGQFWDAAAVRGSLEDEIAGMVGEGGKEQIAAMIDKANQPGRGLLAGTIGVAVLLLGATGVFGQLQHALNRVWEVEPDPAQGGVKNFILKRVLSLGMVLAFGFLLLVSLVLTTVLSSMGDLLSGLLPDEVSSVVPVVIHLAVSLVVITLLFAAMFKLLPDAQLTWRQVWFGAGVTAVLFLIGKTAIGMYLANKDPGAYGAAGSLVLILLWVYYTSLIVFFGAEFTQAWSHSRGEAIEPKPGAVRVEEHKDYKRPAGRAANSPA
jgi:membrane protein